ncbi:hypothetical protein D3C75_627250 [compost metagenome]
MDLKLKQKELDAIEIFLTAARLIGWSIKYENREDVKYISLYKEWNEIILTFFTDNEIIKNAKIEGLTFREKYYDDEFDKYAEFLNFVMINEL